MEEMLAEAGFDPGWVQVVYEDFKTILVDKNSAKMEAKWFPYTPRKFQLFTDLTTHIYSPGLWSFIKAAISGLKLEGSVKKLAKK